MCGGVCGCVWVCGCVCGCVWVWVWLWVCDNAGATIVMDSTGATIMETTSSHRACSNLYKIGS